MKHHLTHESELIAPPCNSSLSSEPNKTQTIINVIRAEGPLTQDELFERMQELLGPTRGAKQKISSLLYQLTSLSRPRRLVYDEEDRIALPATEERAPLSEQHRRLFQRRADLLRELNALDDEIAALDELVALDASNIESA